MTNPMAEQRLIQSYVRDRFFVSTILRRSSAVNGPTEYYETMVWSWDAQTKERGALIEQSDSGWAPKLALIDHASVCERYAEMAPEPSLEEIEAHG